MFVFVAPLCEKKQKKKTYRALGKGRREDNDDDDESGVARVWSIDKMAYLSRDNLNK